MLLVSSIATVAVNIGLLGTSLSMQTLAFSAGAVASTATVSGLVAIPITLLIGALSDRLGRQRFLMLSYMLAAGGALTLMVAAQVWHFWLAATLIMAARCISGSLASALATDILPPEALSRGLPWLRTLDAGAKIVSFATAGYVIDTLGATGLYLIAATLTVLAIPLLRLLAPRRQTALPTRSTPVTTPLVVPALITQPVTVAHVDRTPTTVAHK